jgi:tripartite ATP-independent transporter DctM subunit
LVPVVIVGGITSGLATPTESAALGSVAAYLIGRFVYKDLKTNRLFGVLTGTALTSAMVLFLVATANIFGWVIVFEKIPQILAAWLTGLTSDAFTFLLLVNAAMLLVGMVIDGIAALILIVPLLLPVAMNVYGISPFHFGVIICINMVLGLLTPPVGTGLFVASAAANVPPGRIFVALLPFLLTTVVVLVLLSWQPALVTVFIE